MNEAASSCVKCGCREPGAGRLLHCLHVLCGGRCLDESLDANNQIRCQRCGKITKSAGAGEWDLRKSLPLAERFLYPSKETIEDDQEKICISCDEAAVSVCEDCASPTLFCHEHATKHASRARGGVSHRPRDLVHQPPSDQSQEQEEVRVSEQLCQIHCSRSLVWWCESCHVLLCVLCKTSGHNKGHTVLSCQDVAREKSRKLESALKCLSAYSATEARCLEEAPPAAVAADHAAALTAASAIPAVLVPGLSRSTRPGGGVGGPLRVSDVLSEIDTSLSDLVQQGEKASESVSRAFRELRSALEEHEQAALNKIDKICRSKEDRLRHKRELLERLNEEGLAIKRISSELQSPRASSIDVIHLAGKLVERADQLREAWEDEQSACVQTLLHVDTARTAAAVNSIRVAASKAISVHDHAIDPAQCTIGELTRRSGHKELTIAVKIDQNKLLRHALKQSRVYVQCRYPSGKVRRLQAEYHEGLQGKLRALLRLDEYGCYAFRVGSGKTPWKEYCHDFIGPEHFDSNACARCIQLKDDDQVAVHKPDNSWKRAIVLGAKPYVRGTHTWKVHVRNVSCAIGVFKYRGPMASYETEPPDTDWYGWYSNGSSHGGRTRKSGAAIDEGEQVTSGVLTLTLDCDQSTLKLHQERTGKTATMHGLAADGCQCLRAMVFMYRFNRLSRVELW
eukprot:scpid50618/ scgid31675/ 